MYSQLLIVFTALAGLASAGGESSSPLSVTATTTTPSGLPHSVPHSFPTGGFSGAQECYCRCVPEGAGGLFPPPSPPGSNFTTVEPSFGVPTITANASISEIPTPFPVNSTFSGSLFTVPTTFTNISTASATASGSASSPTTVSID